ncbi:MAG TPA: NAD-dependent epimerase/dehydratase family protein [candidate division Zixibacteria bacterium]|nr:NAD-dependent epimerase/dehydratase family protein [candidate division Zixibacteria bacterium]HER00117.1 NAD-dependent epimerase/dehydratase family protein [candidate division Zixibacteria bacterium]
MKALITGVPGFAGSHLAENLLGHNYEVYGTHLPGESLRNLHGFRGELELSAMDFHKPERIPGLLKKIEPDYIFHLAALPSVAGSFLDPLETYTVNFMGSFHLMQAALDLKQLKKLIIISSSDIYGLVKQKDLPIKIEHPLQPVSPYAVSKATCDMMGYQYFINYGLPVVRIRAFSHSGPRQARGFVIPDFSFQIAQLEKFRKRRRVIRVGNLNARRDISDVRDIANGYRLAAEKGKPGEVYQLCSGKAYAISTILKKLIKLSHHKIEIETDPKLSRPTDIPVLKGDASKAEKSLGYKRKYSIDDTLRDCLDYYRSL